MLKLLRFYTGDIFSLSNLIKKNKARVHQLRPLIRQACIIDKNHKIRALILVHSETVTRKIYHEEMQTIQKKLEN